MSLFVSKKPTKSTYKHRDVIVHRFDKIMLLSCIKLNQNKYELTYILDFIYSLNDNKTMIPIKTFIDFDEYSRISRLQFGVWLRYSPKYFKDNYLYVYRNINDNRLIFKSTKHDNYLKNGNLNQYNHELIFKGSLADKAILEFLG